MFGLAFEQPTDLALFHGFACALPVDFLVRASGSPHLNQATTARLPFPDLDATAPDLARAMRLRALRLNCLTTHYADLWAECWEEGFRTYGWATDDPRMPSNADLGPTWTRDTPLRTDWARRWALVELDVLAARALGLTLEELLTIYRVNFHVLQDYEATTLYDQTGRIAFRKRHTLTNSDARTEWDSRLAAANHDPTAADLTPIACTVEGREHVVYHPPLAATDREGDYGRVWGWWEGGDE